MSISISPKTCSEIGIGWTPEELVIKMSDFKIKSGSLLAPADVRWSHFNLVLFSSVNNFRSGEIRTSAKSNLAIISESETVAICTVIFLLTEIILS